MQTVPVEKDTVPRYAPSKVIVASMQSFREHGGGWRAPVLQYRAVPAGAPDAPKWIGSEGQTALCLHTEKGDRWYGFDRCYINAELRMVVVGFNARFEEVRNWEVVPEDCR